MSTRTLRFSPALLLFLAACSSGSSGGGGGGNPVTLSGEVQFVPEMLVAQDGPGTLDSTRATISLVPGKPVRIRGQLADGRDALRLRTSRRVAVVARFEGDTKARVAHLDPLSLAFGRPGREARFLARGPFELVVHGEGDGYELNVNAQALEGPVELDGHLGAFLVGDELELTALDGGRASLSCAETLDLVVVAGGALSVLGTDGHEVARLGGSGGEARIEGAPLAEFTLAAHGDHAAPVRIRALASDAQRTLARIHPLRTEREAFALGSEAALATAVTHEFVAGELLVRARAGQDLTQDIARRSGRVTQRIPETSDLVAFELPAGLDSQEAARTTLALVAAFETSERVEWAEPNRIRKPLGGIREPDDEFYPLQWHYELIRLPQAWDVTQGSASVIVAVIDTGSRPHPDLDANTNLLADFDFISSATNAGDGNGIDNDSTDVGDGNGFTPSSFHGTHVAGTIGAVGDNTTGVTGVNWLSQIMHLRVLGKQGGTDADITNAIRYAAGLSNSSGTLPAQPARVINMSLGGPGASSTTQSAITAARNTIPGVVIFAAAGNENSSQPLFPASFAGVVSVSAVDLNAEKAPYSNFGPNVDIAAPGGDTSVDLNGDGFADGVLSTLVDEDTPGFPPIFVFFQGTSMACPHAAGLAALMLSVVPGLTPAQIETFMQSTALDLGTSGRDDIFGHGLIQADVAVAAAQGSTSLTPLILASPSVLNFGTEATQLTINVANGGGGTLDVGTPTFMPTGIEVFASLQTVASGGSSDVSAVVVTVNRAGLLDGPYSGVVTIPSDGGDALVNIAMEVLTLPTPLDVPLFVLLVPTDPVLEFLAVAVAEINPTTGLSWTIQSTGVPAGDYILVCGSDEELDFDIFDVGDVYTGAWPTVDEIEVLSLFPGDTLPGLDFVVAPAQQTRNPGPGFPPPGGFRFPRPPGANADS